MKTVIRVFTLINKTSWVIATIGINLIPYFQPDYLPFNITVMSTKQILPVAAFTNMV